MRWFQVSKERHPVSASNNHSGWKCLPSSPADSERKTGFLYGSRWSDVSTGRSVLADSRIRILHFVSGNNCLGAVPATARYAVRTPPLPVVEKDGSEDELTAHAAKLAFSHQAPDKENGEQRADQYGEGRVHGSQFGQDNCPANPLSVAVMLVTAGCAKQGSRCRTPAANGQPVSLNNIANRQILTTLNRCAICSKDKSAHVAATVDHEFKKDPSLPPWHGWHAFRRGLATNLNRLGVAGKTIQAILRHANLSTTMNIYVQTVDEDSVKAMSALEALMCAERAPEKAEADTPVVN